jgi:hypothetical protein
MHFESYTHTHGNQEQTMKKIEFAELEYTSQRDRERHDAIRVSWAEITEVLGHPHRGEPEEDQALVDMLLASGAPAWVRGAEGWTDEQGWGLVGPPVES